MIKIFVFLATSLAWQGCDLDLLKACSEVQDETLHPSQSRYSSFRKLPAESDSDDDNVPDRVIDPDELRLNLAHMKARLREHLDGDKQARKRDLSLGFHNLMSSMSFSPLESPATSNESGSGRVTPVNNRGRTASDCIPIKGAMPPIEEREVDLSGYMFEKYFKEYKASFQQSTEQKESPAAYDEFVIIDNSGNVDDSEGEYMTDDDGSSIESNEDEDHLEERLEEMDIPF